MRTMRNSVADKLSRLDAIKNDDGAGDPGTTAERQAVRLGRMPQAAFFTAAVGSGGLS